MRTRILPTIAVAVVALTIDVRRAVDVDRANVVGRPGLSRGVDD